jgi:hypothetical protein
VVLLVENDQKMKITKKVKLIGHKVGLFVLHPKAATVQSDFLKLEEHVSKLVSILRLHEDHSLEKENDLVTEEEIDEVQIQKRKPSSTATIKTVFSCPLDQRNLHRSEKLGEIQVMIVNVVCGISRD